MSSPDFVVSGFSRTSKRWSSIVPARVAQAAAVFGLDCRMFDMPIRRVLIVPGVAMCLLPTAGFAQNAPLASILPELLGNTITLLPSNLPDQPNHVAHFKPGPDQLVVPTQVNQALLTLLSTYPVGTPSGGFTYTFDPALGH
jgi:hypothetical protein